MIAVQNLPAGHVVTLERGEYRAIAVAHCGKRSDPYRGGVARFRFSKRRGPVCPGNGFDRAWLGYPGMDGDWHRVLVRVGQPIHDGDRYTYVRGAPGRRSHLRRIW
jgi:hypothetical protein